MNRDVYMLDYLRALNLDLNDVGLRREIQAWQ